jgi:hypothetical protein
MMEVRKVVFLSFKTYFHCLCTCVLVFLVLYIISCKEIVHSETVMQPKVLSTSLKEKGNSYKISFDKGSSASTSRSIVSVLKVTQKGLVTLTSSKTSMEIGLYQDIDCKNAVTITKPGTYYVKVTQHAYMIDLTDHSLAKFKKASVTLKIAQIPCDNATLKDKTYTITSGTPKLSFKVDQGYITLRSDYLKDNKYVKGGRYGLYEDHKLLKTVDGNSDIALSKGSYVLVPDGKAAYRVKYTYHNVTVKNTSLKKATKLTLGKTVKGACFNGKARFYKIVLKEQKKVRITLEKALSLDLFSLDDEGDKHYYKLSENRSDDDQNYSVTLSENTYYLKVKPKKNSDVFYHLLAKA